MRWAARLPLESPEADREAEGVGEDEADFPKVALWREKEGAYGWGGGICEGGDAAWAQVPKGRARKKVWVRFMQAWPEHEGAFFKAWAEWEAIQ